MEKYEYSILEACERLHMIKTGARIQFSDEEEIQLRAFLITRRMDWEPSRGSDAYDNAVWNLITETLKEWA